MSAGISIGTQGIGIEGQMPVMRQWQVRLGTTVLPFSITNDYYAFPTRVTVINTDALFAKLHLIVDWEPFTDRQTILNKVAISGGLSYFFEAKTKSRMKLRDPYYYGDIELGPDDVGELLVKSEWKGFAPYAGVGLNRLRLHDAFKLDVTMGAFYLSSPSANITGTKMLEDNEQNTFQLQKNLKNYYRVMPSLQFSINYTIDRNEK
ncbi:hypothetical protein [Pontibacter korlensis]|nr:hypothetical protein [Pontibacter korlensis]